MLSKEEVQDIIDKLQELKQAGKGKKQGDDGGANSKEARLASLQKKDPGSMIIIKNDACDLNNHANNDSKPYYPVTFHALNGDQVTVSLLEEDKKECKESELKKPKFDVKIEDTLEYTKMMDEGIADMVEIDELNPATLLFNMASRYKIYEINVYVGPILLVMNPFKFVPHLGKDAVLHKYLEIIKSDTPQQLKKDLAPHIYVISAISYSQLKDQRTRQAIVISGESGAGKTESAKIAMEFLTELSRQGDNAEESKEDEEDIGTRILACNPILEGFGNAKTVRNNNSSRFGKYTLMYFSLFEDKVLGAKIKNYLLEKSRVIKVAPNERGYHIFYFLLRGGEQKLLEDIFLIDPKTKKPYEWKEFNYLKTGGDLTVEHDVDGYKEIMETFIKLKFSEDEMDKVWRMLSAVLHLGQIEFDEKQFAEGEKPCGVKNPDVTEKICKLLGYKDLGILEKQILFTQKKVAGQMFETPNKIGKCVDTANALSKQMFNNMFNWLVIRMNQTILPDEIKAGDSSFDQKSKTIGLLDIFGFENFNTGNYYEQMCINYVNEKLHKLYISAIFEAEKMELRAEGLGEKVEQIQYPDLKVLDVLQLLDYNPANPKHKALKLNPQPGTGIFTMVDEKTVQLVNTGKETKYTELEDTIVTAHAKTKKHVYQQKKQKRGVDKAQFMVMHSAQDVVYDMNDFIDRNVDALAEPIEKSIKEDADPTVSRIYQNLMEGEEPPEESKGKKIAKTIWAKFNVQMEDLMNELAEPLLAIGVPEGAKPTDVEPCELHFIRCIKPRPKPESKTDRPGLFVHSMTLQQITYMGVLESVALKQKNFPYRKKFEEFYAEYEILHGRFAEKRYYQMDKGSEDFQGMSCEIVLKTMQGCGEEFYALGNTKILMMPETKAVLDAAKNKASEKRDKAAAFLKQSYCLYLGATQSKDTKRYLHLTQAMYKRKYNKKKENWSQAFKEKFEAAVIAYKAEKRKTYEQRAGQVMQDVYRKHMFRNALKRSLRARDAVTKSTYNAAFILKLQKYLSSSILATRVVNNAFNKARGQVIDRACWNVQRSFRGYMARRDKMDWVKEAIASKENLRLHVSAKKVQRRLKGLIVRRRIDHLNKMAAKIQAHFRRRWFRQVFLMIKKNTLILQRGIRRYMARRDMIKERMTTYLTQEYQVLNNSQNMEHFQLFGADNIVRNKTPYSLQKIYLFSRVADMHINTDLSEVHSTPWASQWTKLYRDGIQADNPMMQVQVGTCHSLAVSGKGKLYSWGWNDNGQCAKDPNIIDEVVIKDNSRVALVNVDAALGRAVEPGVTAPTKLRQIVAQEDRCLLLTADTNEVLAFGRNDKGQLGLGQYQDAFLPTKVDYFSRQNLKVTSLAAGGIINLACTENGDAFIWPFTKGSSRYSIPVKMPFSEKIKVSRVSCGYNFGFFISSQGLVYSVGQDNSDGQLGLGHVYPNDIPELITCFKDTGERIDSIECGFRHAIAKSTLGKVYTWGWNLHGQLGHGHYNSELSPRPLTLERGALNKTKAIQIAAGYCHSVIMTDNAREIIWMGTSGELNKQCVPVPMNLSERLSGLFPENNSMIHAMGQQVDFAVVKVNVTWSKAFSLTNLTVADLRSIHGTCTHQKLQNALSQLATRWDQRDIMPPYIESISGMFSSHTMRKPNKPVSNTIKKTNNAGLSQTSQYQRTAQVLQRKPRVPTARN